MKKLTTSVEITDDLTTTRVILQSLIEAHKSTKRASNSRALMISHLEKANQWALQALCDQPIEE